MKTKKEVEKALENCKSIRTSKNPKKSLCSLYPGEPICQIIDKSHLRIIKDLKLLYNYNWIDPKDITRLFGKEGIDKCDILVSARRMEKKDGKYRIISSPAKRRKSMGAVS